MRQAEWRPLKEYNNILILAGLSSGKRATIWTLSRTIPMNSITWVGPRVLAATVGTLVGKGKDPQPDRAKFLYIDWQRQPQGVGMQK